MVVTVIAVIPPAVTAARVVVAITRHIADRRAGDNDARRAHGRNDNYRRRTNWSRLSDDNYRPGQGRKR